MKNSDRNLVKQMIKNGRFNAVADFMPALIDAEAKDMIKKMGTKWACHKDNHVKRLDVPLDILKTHQSRVLRK